MFDEMTHRNTNHFVLYEFVLLRISRAFALWAGLSFSETSALKGFYIMSGFCSDDSFSFIKRVFFFFFFL